MTDVLVVYATRNGSTGEVAEAVGAAASTHGADVQVTEVRSMTSRPGSTAGGNSIGP